MALRTEDDDPEITTTHGLMRASKLRKVVDVRENDDERAEAIEYYLGSELVHRSVHVHLKKSVTLESEVAKFG